MTDVQSDARPAATSDLASLILTIPPARRSAALQGVLSFRAHRTPEQSFAIGPLRAAFADYWETRFGQPIPLERIRAVLEPPIPIGTVLIFNKLMLMRDAAEIEAAFNQLADHLLTRLHELDSSTQLHLFELSDEPVSPGPYLELYGRAELPNSAWTVYGNHVERRLF